MINKKKLKNKLLNHILNKGQKRVSEKILLKNFKSIQKSQKKSHNDIVMLTVINVTPMFRIIKLKNKKGRKKSVTEIPAFLSNYKYRTSWGLKYLVKNSTLKTTDSFFKKLKSEITNNTTNDGNVVTFKNDIQNKALQKKKYFRHYRW